MHDVYRGWRRVTDAYAGDRVFVGEVWVHDPERLARYLRADELHTAFNFDLPARAVGRRGDARGDRPTASPRSRRSARRRPGCCPTTTSSATSPATAAGALGVRRARAAALLMLALPGGAYVYQGEELGLPEVIDLPDEVRQDPDVRAHDPGLVAERRPRRLPGADPVVGRRAAVRLRARAPASRGCRSPPTGRR